MDSALTPLLTAQPSPLNPLPTASGDLVLPWNVYIIGSRKEPNVPLANAAAAEKHRSTLADIQLAYSADGSHYAGDKEREEAPSASYAVVCRRFAPGQEDDGELVQLALPVAPEVDNVVCEGMAIAEALKQATMELVAVLQSRDAAALGSAGGRFTQPPQPLQGLDRSRQSAGPKAGKAIATAARAVGSAGVGAKTDDAAFAEEVALANSERDGDPNPAGGNDIGSVAKTGDGGDSAVAGDVQTWTTAVARIFSDSQSWLKLLKDFRHAWRESKGYRKSSLALCYNHACRLRSIPGLRVTLELHWVPSHLEEKTPANLRPLLG